jgi:hypothetical protein
MSGKGSHSRPFSVPYEEYADRWDNIFKKKISKNVPEEQARQEKSIEEYPYGFPPAIKGGRFYKED